MATQTGGGAPAPARVYRWEPTPRGGDSGMTLRTDDDRSIVEAAVAEYWCRTPNGWLWMLRGATVVWSADDEDAVRRACLLAVLHAPDADERGEQGGTVR